MLTVWALLQSLGNANQEFEMYPVLISIGNLNRATRITLA
jgi:hypothetical protein